MYGDDLAKQVETGMVRPQTPRGRLEDQKKHLEKKLVEINEALKLLDENPLFEKCFEALQRAL